MFFIFIVSFILFQAIIKINKLLLIQVTIGDFDELKAPNTVFSESSPLLPLKISKPKDLNISENSFKDKIIEEEQPILIKLLNCFEEDRVINKKSNTESVKFEFNREVELHRLNQEFIISKTDFIKGCQKVFNIDLSFLHQEKKIKKPIALQLIKRIAEIFWVQDNKIIVSLDFKPEVKKKSYIFKEGIPATKTQINLPTLPMPFEYKKTEIINKNEAEIMFEKNFVEIYDKHFRNKKQFNVDDILIRDVYNEDENMEMENSISKPYFKNNTKNNDQTILEDFNFEQRVLADGENSILFIRSITNREIENSSLTFLKKHTSKLVQSKFYFKFPDKGYGYIFLRIEFLKDFNDIDFISLSSYTPLRRHVNYCKIFDKKAIVNSYY